MSWARQLIENRLQNARENLDVLDKNLKRMTGKSDASMPNSARRRIGGPTSGQLSVKARLQPPVQSGRRAPASARVDQKPKDKTDDGFESEEEAEDSAGAQTLKSNVSVAAKANEVSFSFKVLSDDTTKQRGRRFFGMLTQTLHSFQEKENEKKPVLEKRAEIEKKVEAVEKLEKAEAAVERRELFKERMMREEEIAQLNAKMDRAQMLEDWELAMQKTKGNIMTNSRPPIFYRPKSFNSRLTELQKRTEKYIDSLIFEREEEMKQELHILPSEENSAGDEDEERSGGTRNKPQSRLLTSSNFPEYKIGSENSSSRRLGSNLAGKVTNGLEEKSAAKSSASNVEAAEQSVVSSEKHALTSGDRNGDPTEAPKSLAEELGAPSEDIENLLVEQPPAELPKKESATSVASAIVIQTDFSSSKAASELDVKESPLGSKSSKSSPTKKQRNYRQRSRSNSEGRKKRKEASPVKKASKPDAKKAGDKKECHRRKSERSSSTSKAVTNEHRSKADATDSSKKKSETVKEREKVAKRNRSAERERGRAEKADRSKERKENTAAVKKQRKHSSSRSSGSSSSPDEPRKKASRPTNQKEKKTIASGETKSVAPKRDSLESKKDDKEIEAGSGNSSLKLKSYNTTFGSELKKVKQLSEKENSSAAPKVSKRESAHTIPAEKPETVSTTKEPVKERPLPEPERPASGVQSSLPKAVETPKTQTPQVETPKLAKIEVPPHVVEYPTHSLLKTPALYKNVNPSLLPVDHENLTFKITSAFQAAPTPPNLPPVYKTLSSITPVVAIEDVEKPIPGIASTTEPTQKLETTTASNQSVVPANTASLSVPEKKRNGSVNAVNSETAEDQVSVVNTNSTTTPATTNSAPNGMSNKTAAAVKKRRSVSSSSSSGSGSENSSVGRHSREKRKRRSSPARRHPRRASSRKRRRSHSRRRHRGSSPKRVSSASRHHRRRPSRERRRRGGSRRRRRTPSGDRRRRRSPSSSSIESSSTGASGNSSDGSSKSGSVSPRRPGPRH